MKRTLSLLLAMLLLVAVVPLGVFTASAASSGTTGDCTWTLDDEGNLTISGNGRMADYGTKIIQLNINNTNMVDYAVTDAPWGFQFATVTIENGVTNIGNNAFCGCFNLYNVSIADTVTDIGTKAFAFDINLQSIGIPASVVQIAPDAFTNCYQLSFFTVDLRNTVYSVAGNCLIRTENGQKILVRGGNYSKIPNGVTSIGQCAFNGCKGISSCVIPETVTSIGSQSFQDCSNLCFVAVPASVTEIPTSAFQLVEPFFGVTSVMNNPSTVFYVEEDSAALSYAKANGFDFIEAHEDGSYRGITGACTWRIDEHARMTVSGQGAMADYDVDHGVFSPWFFLQASFSFTASVTIEEGVTAIGKDAFYSCTNQTEIGVPTTVTAIGENAFSCWDNVNEKDVVMPGVTLVVKKNSYAHSYAIMNQIAYRIGCIEHSFGDWVETTAPGCVTLGEETRTCSACGATETRPVGAVGHNYVATVTEPGCTTSGFTTHTCSHCGDSYVDTPTVARGHDYVAVVTPPTCTEGGYTTHTCSRCGDTFVNNETASLGHDYSVVARKEATGRIDGYDGHTCSRCGALRIDVVLPATGIATDVIGDLDWDNVVSDDDATWLLLYTFFPDEYPIDDPAACDFDGDGFVSDDDAIWLLLYTFFPDEYPIA